MADASNWNSVKVALDKEWDQTIIPALSTYIEIPNQSPAYDAEWATNGLMEKAFQVLIDWMLAQKVQGMTYDYVQEKGRTPFLLVEIAGTTPTQHTVLMYGHMDKQPPLRPWAEGLDPHKAVIRGNKLYGRGGADDGYALFSAVASVVVLQRHGIPHGRVVVTIEAGEESGSPDLDYFMKRFEDKIGSVDLMICLDSGSMNYDQLWLTTSLRGVATGVLHVETLSEGMHSGVAGGVVPDTFRIVRELLDRVEDSKTGEVKVPETHCVIPDYVVEAAEVMNTVAFREQFATLPGVKTTPGDNKALALRNFWEPSLTVVGANLPDPKVAGNVIRTETAVKLSLRTPPLVDAAKALEAVAKVLEANPPYGAKVHFSREIAGSGCCMPPLKPWLSKALMEGSTHVFGKPFAFQGMGGAIPFIAMLINTYPEAQFIVTGILGPHSNAHGPNEFLNIEYAKGLTCAVSRVVADHYHNTPKA